MRLTPALTRALDWSVLSNRFILLATPIVGTIAGITELARTGSMLDGARTGYLAAGASFLAWAIARELNPDRAWTATVAVVVAPFGLFMARPALLAAAVVLLIARAVANTTGRGLRSADVILLGLVGLGAGFGAAAAGVLAGGAVGLALTALWAERGRVPAAVATCLYVVGATVAAFFADRTEWSSEDLIVLGAGSLLGLVALLGPKHVVVGTDRIGGLIRPARVRTARAVALGMALMGSATAAPAALFPVWTAVATKALQPR